MINRLWLGVGVVSQSTLKTVPVSEEIGRADRLLWFGTRSCLDVGFAGRSALGKGLL